MLRQRFLNVLAISFCVITLINSHLFGQWEQIETYVSDHLYNVFFLDDSTGCAVGWGVSNGAVFLKTTDAGENWTSSIPFGNTLLFSAVFLDDQTVYAAGYDGARQSAMILSSDDGGENWNKSILNQSFGLYTLEFANDEIGYVCGYNGRVFQTTSGGFSWTPLTTGTDLVFRWIKVLDENNVFIAGGSSFSNTNRIYKTDNGGEGWVLVKAFGNTFVIGGIHFWDGDNGIAVGATANEGINRTTDGGENWELVYSTNTAQVLQGVHVTNDHCWAVGGGGRIHYSNDAGQSWVLDEQLESGELLSDVFVTNLHVFAVGENGSIFRRENPHNVEDKIELHYPGSAVLCNSYPNPFNSSTVIHYTLPASGYTKAGIYDVNGRLVSSLLDGYQTGGSHTINWNSAGSTAGIYLVRIETRIGTASHKLVVLP